LQCGQFDPSPVGLPLKYRCEDDSGLDSGRVGRRAGVRDIRTGVCKETPPLEFGCPEVPALERQIAKQQQPLGSREGDVITLQKLAEREGVAISLASFEEFPRRSVDPGLIHFHRVWRELAEDLMGNPPRGAIVLAIHRDQIVPALVQDALEIVHGIGGFPRDQLLLRLGEPLAGLGGITPEGGRFRRGERLSQGSG
jgi:hypothetical protein